MQCREAVRVGQDGSQHVNSEDKAPSKLASIQGSYTRQGRVIMYGDVIAIRALGLDRRHSVWLGELETNRAAISNLKHTNSTTPS